MNSIVTLYGRIETNQKPDPMKTIKTIAILLSIIGLLIAGACYANPDSLKATKDTVALTSSHTSTSIVKESVKENILGALTIGDYIAAFVISFAGMLIRWYITTRKAIKTNPETPHKFSLMFWVRDNVLTKLGSLGATIAVIYAFMRFSIDLIGQPATMFLAFLIGLFFDWAVDLLDNIRPPRAKQEPTRPADSISTPN